MHAQFYSPPVKRVTENTKGRDLIVGDIHGSFGLLRETLKEARFDTAVDRLFIVGDLVDRGPQSWYAVDLLSKSWVHSIRGNHEDMFLQMYEDTDQPEQEILNYFCSKKGILAKNGMDWWLDFPQEKRLATIAAFRRLPLVIEIPTQRGMVGIVHAEVPIGMNWQDFTKNVQEGHRRTVESALWGRTRLESGNESGVPGIDRLYVGHTIQYGKLKKHGNIYAIDTGAVASLYGHEETKLTITGLMTATQVLSAPKSREVDTIDLRSLIDLRLDGKEKKTQTAGHPNGAFGKYTM